MELFRLFGTVLIDDKDAIESLKSVDKKGKETKTSLQDIANKGAKIGAAVVAGAGVAVAGLLTLANSTSETAAGWLELSQRTDIGIESLQRWGYAASQSGADIGVLETGMKKLSNTMVDAQNGSETAKTAYEQLGISMSDLSSMTPEAAFETVMNSLADMEEGALKNSIGNDLLGKSYTELKPLLSEGSEGMQALKDKADELGIVMSGESVVAAEGFGDSMDNVKATFDGVKNKLMLELIPQLSNMLTWFMDKAPQIQEIAGTALGFVSDVIGFIADNSNILIPILGGLLGAIMALQVVSVVTGIMDAWKASTLAQTLAQGGLNAVMAANPIALVILAIGALIAIGTALVMNWDTVKEKATILGSWISEKWDGIKTKTTEIWNGVKDKISNVMDAAKTTISEKLGNIKTAYEENGGGIKGIASATMEGIKGYYTAGFTFIDTLTGGKLTAMVKTIKEKMDSAKTVISGVIEKIKGFFNFKWEFPKLKMPHFTVSGSMNPLKWVEEGVPKIGVDWYAKGGIFSKPTIFSTPYGLKGVGDAKSPEVVAPLDVLNSMISQGITKAIAPLFLKQSQEAPIIETDIYMTDGPIYKSTQRSQKQTGKMNGYILKTTL
jgi:hypothetical protein